MNCFYCLHFFHAPEYSAVQYVFSEPVVCQTNNHCGVQVGNFFTMDISLSSQSISGHSSASMEGDDSELSQLMQPSQVVIYFVSQSWTIAAFFKNLYC